MDSARPDCVDREDLMPPFAPDLELGPGFAGHNRFHRPSSRFTITPALLNAAGRE